MKSRIVMSKKIRKTKMTQEQLEREVPRIVEHIKEYVTNAGCKGVIIGNSGGKDCATVIGLAKMALGSENVYTLAMPCHSIEEDLEDAKLVKSCSPIKYLLASFIASISNGFST